jgi:hypothetical protein
LWSGTAGQARFRASHQIRALKFVSCPKQLSRYFLDSEPMKRGICPGIYDQLYFRRTISTFRTFKIDRFLNFLQTRKIWMAPSSAGNI